MLVRELGRLLIWTIIRGLTYESPAQRRRNVNTRTRTYFLIALGTLAVLLVASL